MTQITFENIAAIIPNYSMVGDTTMIIKTDGSKQIIDHSIRTVLNRLADSRATNLIALKQRASSATEQRIFLPLAIAPDLVLSAVKVRTPRVPGDTCTGYFNLHALSSLTVNNNRPYHTTIKLTGNTELPVLWTISTVKKHLQYARLAMTYTAHCPEIPSNLLPIAIKIVGLVHDILSLRNEKE